MNMTQARREVYDAISDDGSTTDMVGRALFKTKDAVRDHIIHLEKAGLVHRARVAYNVCYWFKDKAKAQACLQENKDKPVVHATVQVVKTKTTFEKGAQIIVPPHVQKQECPPFRGLGFSETQPKERAFSSLGVGRYLPDEDAMLRRVARKGA